jgi:activator of 2-hydroxyglutaryl-CoA dehydratase
VKDGLITAGVDIGSTTSKAALWIGDRLGPHITGSSTTNPHATVCECYEKVLHDSGLQDDDVFRWRGSPDDGRQRSSCYSQGDVSHTI